MTPFILAPEGVSFQTSEICKKIKYIDDIDISLDPLRLNDKNPKYHQGDGLGIIETRKFMKRENFNYQKGDIRMIALAEQGFYSPNLYNSACMPIVKFRGHYFTEIEVAVLSLIGEGYSNNEIAERLQLGKRTVESHVYSVRLAITEKLQSSLNERQLVLFARDMLEGYQVFIKLIHEKLDESKYPFRGKLIEDWDTEEFSELDEVLENELDGLYGAQPQKIPFENPITPLKPEYEIADFEAEPREIIFSDGKYYLV